MSDHKMRPVALYVKGKPQGADIESLCVQTQRAFIGYPAWKRNAQWDRHNIRKSLFDLSDSQWSLSDLDANVSRREITRNRNLAGLVGPGSFIAMPRPGKGICHISRVRGPFELVDDPPWAQDFLDLRSGQNLTTEDEADHIPDVVQGWPVEEWRQVPFPIIPRWITYRLLSRNTVGPIYERPDGGLQAVDVLRELYEGTYRPPLSPTTDEDEIKSRLLTFVSPNAFEHLVCTLLQLQHPAWHWFHTGGSGDDGCDGLAIDNNGRVVAALQCKWMPHRKPTVLGSELHSRISNRWGKDVKVYIATLFGEEVTDEGVPAVTCLSIREIAQLMVRFAVQCPFSQTIGIVPVA